MRVAAATEEARASAASVATAVATAATLRAVARMEVAMVAVMKMVVGNLQTHKSMVKNTSAFAFFLKAARGQGWVQAPTKKYEKRANTISRAASLPRPQIKTATVQNRAAAVVSGCVRTVCRDADGQRA